MEEIVYHTNYQLEDKYWWFVARNRLIRKLINRICLIPKGDNVLDIGCGTGGFAKLISDDFNVLCLDTSGIALDYCKKRGLKNLFNMTLDKFPREQWKVKAAIMLDVVEHIKDDKDIVSQVFNLLPEKGYFIASVPAYQWLWSRHDEIHMHYRRYNRKNFLKLLMDAGFQIEFCSYINCFLFIPAVIVRFLQKLGKEKKSGVGFDVVPDILNSFMRKIFYSESLFLRFMRFPFGLSLVTIARKP